MQTPNNEPDHLCALLVRRGVPPAYARRLAGEVADHRADLVSELIAGGATNRQIEAALVITERTAANHAQHILAKLGFQSRAQIAAWAVDQRLPIASNRSS